VESDTTHESLVDLERELRAIERELARQRRELHAELTEAFRRLNEDALHDASERTYPLSEPEKQAVRRETVGPVKLLPDWEETYRELAADQRTARDRLAAFHEDVFGALADEEPYTVETETNARVLDGPYLELRVRADDRVAVFEIDNPETEGYTYRTNGEYTEQDVENALSLCRRIDEVDLERVGFLTYNTDIVDHASISAEIDDPDEFRRRVQVEILETLTDLAYDYVDSEGSPILTVLEALETAGFRDG